MSMIDGVKRDRKANTDGFHWIGETLMAKEFGEVIELCNVDWSGVDEFEAEHKRRIARVPDIEAALIAAEKGLRDVIGMLDDPTGDEHVRDMRGATVIARATLAKITEGKA